MPYFVVSAWVSFRRSGVRQHVFPLGARAGKKGSYVFLYLVLRRALPPPHAILLKRIESRRLHVLAIAASAAEEAATRL